MGTKVSTEDFIKAWTTAHAVGQSISWVAQETGLTRQAVHLRVKILRNNKIDLPRLTHGNAVLAEQRNRADYQKWLVKE